MTLKVNEIFPSLQGEGVYTGIPTVFVRLQGCNLACTWCDTKYAWGNTGKRWEIEDIADKCADLAKGASYEKWICITGGEPLFQPDSELHALVVKLNYYGFKTEIETNGTYPKPKWWRLVDSWVADLKCPSSGFESDVAEWMDTREQDQVKLVLQGIDDLEYARLIIRSNTMVKPTILVSPVWDSIGWMQEVWSFCVEERKVRLSIQIHKVVWGSEKREI